MRQPTLRQPIANSTSGQPRANIDLETLQLSRTAVRDLLLRSAAFRQLPPDQQRDIAKHTVEIASYLAAPEGIRANTLSTGRGAVAPDDPYAMGLADQEPQSRSRSRSRGRNVNEEGVFVAQAAREGAEVAGALLENVDFPAFVSGLINGVFTSIVDTSIRQMEAYGQLVASVAQTLNQFRDQNVSANQGRDHLVDTYPDMFQLEMDTGEWGEEESGGGPRVRLRDGVDERTAMQRLNSDLPIEGQPITNLDDETIEGRLVPAARTQLATSRQQLLATMVLMGINRIIVTDGRIAAKVLYDFRARDNMRYQRSATSFDYDPTKRRYGGEGEYESDYQGGERSYEQSQLTSQRDASYYAQGKYKYSNDPVLTAASASTTAIDASIETKASLMGSVEVNFKSETFPLERMADSFQIGMIQNAAQPRGGRGVTPTQSSTSSPANGAPSAPAT